MCSKLDFFLSGIRNQPHLWMSRQARSVSSQSPESGLHQLPASIAKSKIPSSCIHKSFGSFFGAHLWISRSIVEICRACTLSSWEFGNRRPPDNTMLPPSESQWETSNCFEGEDLSPKRPCPCPQHCSRRSR